MTLPIGQIENYRKARTIYSSSNTRKLLKNEIRTEFSMRYGNRLKLHTSRKHPYPGESSLLRTLPWEVDVLYQPNKELSQSRNNLQPGSYGCSIETGQFKSPAPLAANDYRLIAAYPCRRLSNKYRNMTSSGPIGKTERYRKKQAHPFNVASIYRFRILTDPSPVSERQLINPI